MKPYQKQQHIGVINRVAGVLKSRDKLYKDLLHIREDEGDREDTLIE